MSIIAGIWWTLLGIGATALTVVVIRTSLKNRAIARIVASLTQTDLDTIYSLVESVGTERPTGGVLARTNELTDEGSLLCIPAELSGFPWADRSYSIETGDQVLFKHVGPSLGHSKLQGRVYRYVGTPRHKLKSGKVRNIFDPGRLLAASPALARAMSARSPRYPREVLSYLLCDGNWNFESIDQIRIGTSPEWVQSAEFRICPVCRKRLLLVIQLPGILLPTKRYREATLYLLGCPTHPNHTETVIQFS